MKKIIVFVILLVASLGASAQYEVGKFSIQPKLGFGLSFISNTETVSVNLNNNSYDLDKRLNGGSHLGIEFEYQALKWLGIAAGLNYTHQGTAWENHKIKVSGVKYESFDNKIELGYINLPIVANFYVAKGLALKTGLQAGFLTDAHLKSSERTSLTSHDNTTDIDTKMTDLTEASSNIRKDCNKFDLAIPVGISYEFKHHFIIDARYNFGLLKVNQDKSVFWGYAKNTKGDCRNNSFQMSFGWKFKL